MFQRHHRSVARVGLGILVGLFVSVQAFAQAGRVSGTVKDTDGKPIKGATISAENPQASPSSFTAVTDDNGHFAILGLRAGNWTFTAVAPGHLPSQGSLRVQTLNRNPDLSFTLEKGANPTVAGLAGVNSEELMKELQAAELLFNSKEYDQAIAAYKAILEKAPVLTSVNLQIGRAYRLKKDYDQALAAYGEVLKADPTNENAKVEIGMTNLEKGDLDAADTTLTAAAENPGASREVLYTLGEVKFAKNEPEEAAKWYQKATDADPSWAKPLFKLGLVALNKGDKEGAISYMEKVLAAEPDSAEAAQATAVLEQLKK